MFKSNIPTCRHTALALTIVGVIFLAGCGSEANSPAPTAAATPAGALAKKLAGTKWAAPGGGEFVFNADGTILSTSNKEVASWTALDGRYVVRKTDGGWIDVLVFDEAATKYSLHPKDFVNDKNASFTGERAK